MLVTVDKDVLRQLVAEMKEDKLVVFDPQFIREIAENVRHPVAESVGKGLKKIPPEIAQEIATYIQKGEFEEPTAWARKLAAHSYAEKLFRAALEQKQADECYGSLQQLARLFEDKGWVAYLEDPNIRFSDKQKVLRAAVGSELVFNLVYKLLEKHETDLLPDINEEYRYLLQGSSVVRVEVTTAITIDAEYEKKIMKYLEKMFGRKVFPMFAVDPRILGGIVIRVGDKILDRSVRRRLLMLSRAMKAEQ